MNIIIADTGAWARDVMEAVEESGYHVKAFMEFWDASKCTDKSLGLPIVWWEDCAQYIYNYVLVHGLGTQNKEEIVSRAATLGFRFATFIHGTARVPKSCKLGKGVFVGPGVVMGSDCQIGDHVTINRHATIGHDVKLGTFVNVSPGANIAGLVEIGRGTYVAMGSCILDTKKIGDYCIVAAGAVVTKNFGNNLKLMGVPARIVEKNIRGK
jgi:acetyltransferase EpsM